MSLQVIWVQAKNTPGFQINHIFANIFFKSNYAGVKNL